MPKWSKYLFLLLIVTTFLFSSFRHWAYDDPFITFRYAENLREGLGFVYNPGERILSTTTPLYALLLSVLGRFWSNLPYLSNFISSLSLVLGGFFLYILGRRWKMPSAGLVAAFLFVFAPLMVTTFGAETCFYVMLILGAFAFYAGEQYECAMIMAALATLTRSDGVLVAVVLAVDFFIHHWRILWRPLFLFALIIIPWYLFSWIYFGSPFPVTLIAKHQQGQMVISDSFAEGFLNLLLNYAKRPLYWSHGILLFVGLWSWAFKARQWTPLFAWGALYFFSYVLLGVSRYFWYYAPLVPIFVSLIGLGVATLSTWLSSVFKQNRYEFALSILFTALLFWPQGQDLFNLRCHPDSRAVVYREVGEWVSTNTEPDASVGTLEVGIIGYYAHRRMIDFAGLIQPDVVRQMHQESTYQETALWAVENYQPDYLILNPLWFPTLMETVVENKCFPQKAFSDETYSGELILYSCDFR